MTNYRDHASSGRTRLAIGPGMWLLIALLIANMLALYLSR
jgi:hypothetical protein